MKKKKRASQFSSTQWIFMFVMSLGLIILAVVYREKLAEFRSLGLLGIFLVNFFGHATLFLPAPAIASVVAGGAVYPPLAVALVSAFGSAFGDLLGFFLGLSGHRVLLEKLKSFNKKFPAILRKYTDIIIFLFALIPNPFFDFVGIAAGVLNYSPYKFFGLIFTARLLRDIILAFAGSNL